ncbi:MAG: hypothetical protein R3350_01800, partial [Saprospiraceae bacterium]|nr:hypothetical protein [Saprospiraceae bacterium]
MRIHHLLLSLALLTLSGGTLTGQISIFDPPPTNNTCVGQQGQLERFIWRGIDDDTLAALYSHPFFPQAPERIRMLTDLETPENYDNDYGSLVRGYLSVPASGEYSFNLTGDDNTRFFL